MKTKHVVREAAMRLLARLQRGIELRAGLNWGICAEIKHHTCNDSQRYNGALEMPWEYAYHDLFSSWEHYSGNSNYPVPCTDDAILYYMTEVLGVSHIEALPAHALSCAATKQYMHCVDKGTHFKGAQLALRISLLRHIIRES